VSSSFDRLIQCFARHAVNRILSSSIDLREHESIRALEGS
jgi:hypothetical protein